MGFAAEFQQHSQPRQLFLLPPKLLFSPLCRFPKITDLTIEVGRLRGLAVDCPPKVVQSGLPVPQVGVPSLQLTLPLAQTPFEIGYFTGLVVGWIHRQTPNFECITRGNPIAGSSPVLRATEKTTEPVQLTLPRLSGASPSPRPSNRHGILLDVFIHAGQPPPRHYRRTPIVKLFRPLQIILFPQRTIVLKSELLDEVDVGHLVAAA